jgi:hypothetical protein
VDAPRKRGVLTAPVQGLRSWPAAEAGRLRCGSEFCGCGCCPVACRRKKGVDVVAPPAGPEKSPPSRRGFRAATGIASALALADMARSGALSNEAKFGGGGLRVSAAVHESKHALSARGRNPDHIGRGGWFLMVAHPTSTRRRTKTPQPRAMRLGAYPAMLRRIETAFSRRRRRRGVQWVPYQGRIAARRIANHCS